MTAPVASLDRLIRSDGGIVPIPSDADILAAASEFRSALDAIDRLHWNRIYIDRFPHGACGHCAELLAFYLQRRFGLTADYVCKEFYDSEGARATSHAWLEWNGLIIDISGDQFGWPAVIVTRQSSLHALGDDELRQPFKLDPIWWGQQCAGVWAAAQQILSARPPTTIQDDANKEPPVHGP
jgi:hypothetical protein